MPTKSVSQFSSTTAPAVASSDTMAMTVPSLVARPAFLATAASPRVRRDVHRLVHVALGLHERLLALHHAGAGHFAQFLDHGSSDVSHDDSFLVRAPPWTTPGMISMPCHAARCRVAPRAAFRALSARALRPDGCAARQTLFGSGLGGLGRSLHCRRGRSLGGLGSRSGSGVFRDRPCRQPSPARPRRRRPASAMKSASRRTERMASSLAGMP